MAIFNNSIIPAAAAAAADVITKSVRFNRADDPYISFTPSSTGDQKKWTNAMWIKRSSVGLSAAAYFGLTCEDHSGEHNNGVCGIYFGGGDDKLDTYFDTSGANPDGAINDRVYRDPASWMQIIWAVDAANTTQRIWVNGVEETVTSSNDPPDYAYAMNKSGHLMAIGTSAWGVGNCFDGYIAQVVHLDGQYITDPTEFGQVDATSGEWTPKELTSSSFTYGTNGALLEFLQTGTGTPSSTTIGADTSGNDNHWSISSIAAEDCVNDCPTDNYCVLNALDSNSNNVLAEGNLEISSSGSVGHYPTFSTMGMRSGKWYWEVLRPSGQGSSFKCAIMSLAHDSGSLSMDSTVGNSTSAVNKVGYSFNGGGTKAHDTTNTSYGSAIGDGGILMVAFDADNGKLYFGKDGTWFDSSDPANSTSPAWSSIDTDTDWGVCIHCYSGHLPWMNFGADPTFGGNDPVATPATSEFAYAPPSGYSSLSTGNLPTPTIAKPSEYFDIKTWTATSTNPKVLDFPWSFASDGGLVWQKMRNSSGSHHLFDTVRGDNKGLYSNLSDVENVSGQTEYYTQDFDGSGDYSIQQDGAGNEVNYSGNTYVAWGWKKSTTAGFGISTYTGTGEMDGDEIAVAHGCGGTPELVIVKDRDGNYGTGFDWIVWHHKLSTDNFLLLSESNAESAWDSSYPLIQAGVTNNTFGIDSGTSGYSLNDGSNSMNGETDYVVYSMRSIEGYSKVGSYEGNNLADGPMVYCGFRPRWICVKRIDGTGPWVIIDATRDPYNDTDSTLAADTTTAESSYAATSDFDILSNGFKLRHSMTYGYANQPDTYIFYAVAESPLKTANGR